MRWYISQIKAYTPAKGPVESILENSRSTILSGSVPQDALIWIAGDFHGFFLGFVNNIQLRVIVCLGSINVVDAVAAASQLSSAPIAFMYYSDHLLDLQHLGIVDIMKTTTLFQLLDHKVVLCFALLQQFAMAVSHWL